MRMISSREKVSAASKPYRGLMFSLNYLKLSPLWAIWLSILSATTLATGLFAIKSILGHVNEEEAVAALDWKPPSLAIISLDSPKLASVDIESVSRPVFSKSRKPAPKTASAVSLAIAGTDTGTLSVTAIVSNKKIQQAFIVSLDAPEGAWRKIGDTVDSWIISSIATNEVVIQSGGQKRLLQLYAHIPDGTVNTTSQSIMPP